MLDRFARSVLALTLALLLAAAPAAAQDTDGTRIGVGVSITDAQIVGNIFEAEGAATGFRPTPSLLVPIDVGETLRIEPLIGYSRQRVEIEFPEGEFVPDNITQTQSTLRLGVGFFGRSSRGDAALYYGARAGYNRLKISLDEEGEDDEDTDDSLGGFFAGPTLGGSYFFSDFFSIGGEIEARYTSISGEIEQPGLPEEDNSVDVTNTTIALRPSLVVRFFF